MTTALLLIFAIGLWAIAVKVTHPDNKKYIVTAASVVSALAIFDLMLSSKPAANESTAIATQAPATAPSEFTHYENAMMYGEHGNLENAVVELQYIQPGSKDYSKAQVKLAEYQSTLYKKNAPNRRELKRYWEESIRYMLATNMGLNISIKFVSQGEEQGLSLLSNTNTIIESGKKHIDSESDRWSEIASPLLSILKDKARMRYLVLKNFEDGSIDQTAAAEEIRPMDDRDEEWLKSAYNAARNQMSALGGQPSEILSYDKLASKETKTIVNAIMAR